MPHLTLSKRFEFSASHRIPGTAPLQEGRYGHGHNFVVFFSFEGPIDPETGMVVELSAIKQKINNELLIQYDHYFLNELPQFQTSVPSVEAIASALLSDALQLFAETPFSPVSVHLFETPTSAATAYQRGAITRHFRHGDLSITLDGPIDPTTQSIASDSDARVALDTLNFGTLPVSLVRHHRGTTTIETRRDGHSFIEVYSPFSATHRLMNPALSITDNQACFGKCSRPHGHMFEVWATLPYTHDRSLTAGQNLQRILSTWNGAALDNLSEFDGALVSVETIIHRLWDKLYAANLPVVRLRIQETPNNRFSLRSPS